jgi:hypothetical protein
MHLKALVRLRSGDEVVMEQPLIDERAPVGPDDPPIGEIKGSVTVGTAGDYRLDLVCADVFGERQVTHTTAFSVE